MEKNRQTVCVLDEKDTVIGYTYPKRAKGLIKKRRAEFVSDNAIRLYRQCPTYDNMEDIEMANTNFITIIPTAWRKNPDGGAKTVCDRFMISNPLAGAVANAQAWWRSYRWAPGTGMPQATSLTVCRCWSRKRSIILYFG